MSRPYFGLCLPSSFWSIPIVRVSFFVLPVSASFHVKRMRFFDRIL